MPTQAIIPQIPRQGTITTASFDIPSGVTQLDFTPNIFIDDKLNPTSSLTLTISVSTDNEATWASLGGISWNGNPSGHDPTLGLRGLDKFPGGKLRMEVTIPVQIRVGASISWQ